MSLVLLVCVVNSDVECYSVPDHASTPWCPGTWAGLSCLAETLADRRVPAQLGSARTPGGLLMDDVEAIKQLKARYCRTMDTKDWAGMREVFTDDVTMDTGIPAAAS